MALADNAEAIRWATAQLPVADYEVTTICQTPFSGVYKINSAAAVYYLKLLPPELSREIAVTAALGNYKSGSVPPVLASNLVLSCFLTPDCGVQLRQHIQAGGDKSLLQQALKDYAALQRATIPPTEELLAMGLPDWQPVNLPDLFSRLLDSEGFKQMAVEPAERGKLEGYVTILAEYCRQLAAIPVSATIEHADFQDKNVLISGDNKLQFIDWGEAVIAHPFFSFTRFMASVARHHGITSGHPDFAKLRAVYLAGWQEFVPSDRLEAALKIVEKISPAYAALAYWQLAEASGSAGQGYWESSIMPLLRSL